MGSFGQHAAPSAPERAPVPEPTLAERGRTLIQLGRVGTLSTHSRKQSGFPFGSVMPYGPDDQGRPVFLISSMAMHTQNLKADARASLLVMQEGGQSEDPLGAARITLVGEVLPVPKEETGAVRKLYLDRHEKARYWVDFDDFGFYRLQLVDVYFVGGFGVMGWVTAKDYADSRPDPLADEADGIMRHMNEDHCESLVLLALAAGERGVEAATVTSVDRLGFHLRMRSGDRVHGMRVSFPQEVREKVQVRTVLVEMVRAARGARGEG
jgi:heme iron utilization protein